MSFMFEWQEQLVSAGNRSERRERFCNHNIKFLYFFPKRARYYNLIGSQRGPGFPGLSLTSVMVTAGNSAGEIVLLVNFCE